MAQKKKKEILFYDQFHKTTRNVWALTMLNAYLVFALSISPGALKYLRGYEEAGTGTILSRQDCPDKGTSRVPHDFTKRNKMRGYSIRPWAGNLWELIR